MWQNFCAPFLEKKTRRQRRAQEKFGREAKGAIGKSSIEAVAVSEDLTDRLGIKGVDGSELRFLLMNQIPGGVMHTGKGKDVLYGAGGEHDYALKLFHGKNDFIYRVEAGPGLTKETLDSLAARVQTDLKDAAGTLVARELLLSERPISGYFRHLDRLQLVPAPGDAPRPPDLPGLSARYPFVLEVQFVASKNPAINELRRFRTISEFELGLTSLLRGSVLSARVTNRRAWAVPAPDDNAWSAFLRSGYACPGFQREASGFSNLTSLEPLTTVPASEYYAREPWTITSLQTLPDNLHLQLQRFYTLSGTGRASWLRACYWLHHSSLVQAYSVSAAFGALVIAVEALMPGSGGKKGTKFQQFVSVYAPNYAKDAARLEQLYGIRANVLHGNNLVYSDREPLSVGITPAMAQSYQDFQDMRRITKNVLVNWLAAENPSPVKE